MWEALALSVALAMDATAVAASRGLLGRRGEVIILPLLFGLFQAGLALAGWLGARAGGELFAAWDHWVAFALLVAVGGKMLFEAWRDRAGPAEAADEADRPRIMLYLLLAIATSIDAAAAGVTLPTLGVDPVITLVLIGLVTVGCSAIGFVIGRSAGARFGARLEIFGGVILIALGVRVLVEHLTPPPTAAPVVEAGAGSSARTSPGTPPHRTIRPLTTDRLAALAALTVPGFAKEIRDQGTVLEVEHTGAGLAATVSVGPCFDCLAMELERWKAMHAALALLVPPEHRDLPETTFELGASALHGAPTIFSYQVAGGSAAYALYYNDGINQIRVVTRPADAASTGAREDLVALATQLLDLYTHAW